MHSRAVLSLAREAPTLSLCVTTDRSRAGSGAPRLSPRQTRRRRAGGGAPCGCRARRRRRPRPPGARARPGRRARGRTRRRPPPRPRPWPAAPCAGAAARAARFSHAPRRLRSLSGALLPGRPLLRGDARARHGSVRVCPWRLLTGRRRRGRGRHRCPRLAQPSPMVAPNQAACEARLQRAWPDAAGLVARRVVRARVQQRGQVQAGQRPARVAGGRVVGRVASGRVAGRGAGGARPAAGRAPAAAGRPAFKRRQAQSAGCPVFARARIQQRVQVRPCRDRPAPSCGPKAGAAAGWRLPPPPAPPPPASAGASE